jgi:hypothetical protein
MELCSKFEGSQRQAENEDASRKQLENSTKPSIAISKFTIETTGDPEIRFSDRNTRSETQTRPTPETRNVIIQLLRENERLNMEIRSATTTLRGLNDRLQEFIVYRRLQRSMNRAP